MNIKISTNISTRKSIAFYFNYIATMGYKYTSNNADLVQPN